MGIGTNSPDEELEGIGSIKCVDVIETSDGRLKTKIQPLTNVLEKIGQVQGVSYEWNQKAKSLIGATLGEKKIGIVAQELEGVYPELVSTNEEGYKAVNYVKLTAVLLEASKELKAENDQLKERIERLEKLVSEQIK